MFSIKRAFIKSIRAAGQACQSDRKREDTPPLSRSIPEGLWGEARANAIEDRTHKLMSSYSKDLKNSSISG